MLSDIDKKIEKLNAIGISLSKEKNCTKLLEAILIGAKEITNADAGTLYLVENEKLCFEIVRTDSLNFAMGGTTGLKITLPPIDMYDDEGVPNLKNISAYSAVKNEVVNIPDAYNACGFDFHGAKEYDKKNNYRSTSFLTIPMSDHENKIIGVLQLINATDPDSNVVTKFSESDQALATSLASQAAVAISHFRLVESLKELLETFIEVIAASIDDKSPYTGGHCRRVPEIVRLMAEGVNNAQSGQYKNIFFTDRDFYELNIAALLHDCGKITTPVHVVDKATKLETIFDRITIIDQRVESAIKDAEIEMLKTCMNTNDEIRKTEAQSEFNEFKHTIIQHHEFLKKCNIGSEFMNDKLVERVKAIQHYTWTNYHGDVLPLITEDECMNLCIRKGTLNDEERRIVNHHIVMTQNMLEALPFPSHLANVPEIAGNHHERMDGKGYPNGIHAGELSIQARLMCIADVFEALTAADRPYKHAMKLSRTLDILNTMAEQSHIDKSLLDVFISEKVYLNYAKQFLSEEQIDCDNFQKNE